MVLKRGLRARALRAVVFLALLSALAWWLAGPFAFSTWHSPIGDSPDKHGIRFEDIRFTAVDEPIPLRAWWMPVDSPKATVIMVHGGGGNRAQPYTDWLDLAGSLIEQHYAVVALDLRNHGESGDSASGFPTFGPDEANDVIAAMNEIARRAPGMRFAGLGHSMGGQTVLYAAVRDPRLEAVVADCTYTDLRSIVPAFAHAISGLPAALFTGPFLWSTEWLHGIPLGAAHAVDVIASIAPRKVLLIHDDADPIVPVEHARRLRQAAPEAALWITQLPPGEPIPEAARNPFGTHAKSYMLNRKAYVSYVVSFFDEVFTPVEPCPVPPVFED